MSSPSWVVAHQLPDSTLALVAKDEELSARPCRTSSSWASDPLESPTLCEKEVRLRTLSLCRDIGELEELILLWLVFYYESSRQKVCAAFAG